MYFRANAFKVNFNMSTQPSDSAAQQSKKRKAEGSQSFGPSAKVTTTGKEYQKFLDAYKGTNLDALGGDNPKKNKNTIDAVGSYRCVLIGSKGDQSKVIPANEEDGTLKVKYDVSSQNPMLEIKLGVPLAEPFQSSHSLFINSEQINGPVERSSIQSPTTDRFGEAAIDLGLPSIDASDESIQMVINWITKGNENAGISFMRLRIKGPLPAPRPTLGYSGSHSPLAAKIAETGPLEYLTVVRLSMDHLSFVDRFWDHLMDRCQKEGIYWGYRLDRKIESDGPEKDMSYPMLVIIGHEQAPYLSWMRDSKSAVVPHKRRTWFSSIKEYEACYTVALIQDMDFQRKQIREIFDFVPDAPAHQLTIEADELNPLRFILRVNVQIPAGKMLPGLGIGSEFKIQLADCVEDLPELDARLVDVPDDAMAEGHLVLEATILELGNPWHRVLADGGIVEVKLAVDINTISAMRQLTAIRAFCQKGKKHEIDLFLGNPPTFPSSEKSIFNRALDALVNDQGKDKHQNRRIYDNHQAWQESLVLNMLQWQAIQTGLDKPISCIQGPPGTGKSEVAVSLALWVALLGYLVLVTGPTNTAGKANAAKFAKVLPQLPEYFRDKVIVVYFPTYSESIERIFEATGYKPRFVTKPQDKEFDDLQVWRHLVTFATAHEKKYPHAAQFLKIYRSLNGQRDRLSDEESAQFKDVFKKLVSDLLLRRDVSMKDTALIALSTCNNSAYLAEMDLKVSLLLIDEAGAVVDPDVLVPLQVEHDHVAFLGDHRQTHPVVPSQSAMEMSETYTMSPFERILEHTAQPRTMLRISYRFGQEIADPVGMFGGYMGLASGTSGDSDFYQLFASWNSAGRSLRTVRRQEPADSLARRKKENGENLSFHRLLLNVADGFSTFADGSLSWVNYTTVISMPA